MTVTTDLKTKLMIAGPLLALLTIFFLSQFVALNAAIVAGVTLWCVIWWTTEPVPLPATSLLPMALFPLLGVLDAGQVASAYGSQVIILLLGGFILSRGMESTGTHRRLAVAMINLSSRVTGNSGDRSVVIGFMLASAVLSMWISNTATTLMLLPIALAVLEKSNSEKLPLALMLGIAYAANVGGMGTPIGTPPNLIFMEVFAENTGERIGFVRWMSWGVPIVLILVPVIAWWLTRKLTNTHCIDLPAVGQWTSAEKRVLSVFAVTALLWITRSEPMGGWSSWFDIPNANDAAIALLGAIALFVVPDGKGGRLLNWEQANAIPWGMLLLFAGGICIAKGFIESGLSAELGNAFGAMLGWPAFLLVLVLCLCVSFMTETTSNTATTTLLMPILAAAAMGAAIRPELLMVPAALSASCAFMLPVATAPNAIALGSGYVPAARMMRTGVTLNLFGAVIVALLCWLIV